MTADRVREVWEKAIGGTRPPDLGEILTRALPDLSNAAALIAEAEQSVVNVIARSQGAQPLDEDVIVAHLILHPGDFDGLAALAGRNYGPTLLALADGAGVDSPPGRPAKVWSMADYPEMRLGTDLWVRLFREAGFTLDGQKATPPDTVQVWRGAPWSRRDGMSWTRDRKVAERFVKGGAAMHRVIDEEPYRLWTRMVRPVSMLAEITTRREAEIILDPSTAGKPVPETPTEGAP